MQCYRFGEFEVRPDERQVIRSGNPVMLGARAFDLLSFLIEHRDRIVTKNEMLDHVWPGIVVEEANLTVHVSALRKVLGPQALATIPGRGYRFVMPLNARPADTAVAEKSTRGSDAGEPSAGPRGDLMRMPDRPSIAVLPFSNMSGEQEQEHFADGLVEDIITTLSKISGLIVIARNSTFSYTDRAVDVRQVGRELGVRYVLEGSVRKSSNRIRITAQLIDAETGAHVWAERFDRAVEDIFAVQDEVTLILATEMQVNLTEGEQARLRYTSTHNIDAWSFWVRGLSCYHRANLSREGMTPALMSWQKANALDPRSASLNAMLGMLYYLDARFGFWNDRETAVRKGSAHVEQALSLDPENSDAHMTQGLLLLLQRRHEEAVRATRLSLQFGPSSADNASFASFVFANAELAQEAVTQIERAVTLSPVFPPFYLGHMGNAYRHAGMIAQAIAAFEAYDKANPGRGVTDLVIIFQQLGQLEKAKVWAGKLLALQPDFTVSAWQKTQFRNDAVRLKADMNSLRAMKLPV